IGGPPLLNNSMRPKLLKLKAKEPIRSGAIDTSSKGNVSERNWVQRLAPSMSAASYISVGMAWSAPRQRSIMYGNPSHVFTNSIPALAHVPSENQGGEKPIRSRSMVLNWPYAGLRRPVQISVLMTNGIV